jgi:dihydroxy-acid dehydratase
VRSGDLIRLDVPQRRLDLLVSEEELQTRATAADSIKSSEMDTSRGYAKLFLDSVLQADQGCDFDFLVKTAPDKDACCEKPNLE